jgi:glycosyltransferase involved in cell wall biosynthesis
VLSVSSRLAERIARDVGFPLERIKVIRNGVDLSRFKPGDRAAARAALGLPLDGLVIGTVGRLVPVKDQRTLLDALSLVRNHRVVFSAVLTGTGPLRDTLVAHSNALGLGDVSFLGNRFDVERVLAAYDVFVLSSESEGLSNTIQEAMACGLPVVATRVGGADELVDENRSGFLVPPRDPPALAEAILCLALDRSRRESMGAAGRRRAEACFGLDNMVREYETMYLNLARRMPEPVPQVESSEA